jgi:hypothetical protein
MMIKSPSVSETGTMRRLDNGYVTLHPEDLNTGPLGIKTRRWAPSRLSGDEAVIISWRFSTSVSQRSLVSVAAGQLYRFTNVAESRG